MVYYVKGDVLRIAAFWDMRMHPDYLRKTIITLKTADAYGQREIVKMRLRGTNQVCGSLRTVSKISLYRDLTSIDDVDSLARLFHTLTV